jgi:hypothetical protein
MQQKRRLPAWKMLICIFVAFWLLFATVLILSNFPFLVISMALTSVGAMSAIVVALAWAWTNNY